MSDTLLSPIEFPELFIGLVAPIGADLNSVGAEIRRQLTSYGYSTHEIRVSDFFATLPIDTKLVDHPTAERYKSYMDAGNEVRRIFDAPDALILPIVGRVREIRRQITGHEREIATKTAFLINQLKRPEEIETLRSIYGPLFLCLSVSCSKSRRLELLTERIARDDQKRRREDSYEPIALSLIIRDEEEEEEKFYGQKVRDAFALADVVVDGENTDRAQKSLERPLKSFFGSNFITPTADEHFMNIARNVASRSSDLSRQVGAVIVTADNEIISAGCNDVPKFGGGIYWEEDELDARDFKRGHDPNYIYKKDLIADILRRINPWMSRKYQKTEINELLEKALNSVDGPLFKNAHLMDLLEFGRVVHAEMNALAEAAKRGVATKDSTLYCTTFPCHICTRHIIAAGIRRVVYVEPYTKSQAQKLYSESVDLGEDGHEVIGKIQFDSFSGISTTRFNDFFVRRRRKNSDGKAKEWIKDKPHPVVDVIAPFYIETEILLIELLERKVVGLAQNSPAAS